MPEISGEMPIGIFDSGVGGLTVMKEISRCLPDEHLIYLGDTARVPYGGRSFETVRKYSLENARFLMSKGIKLLVVACNTSSAVSLELLRENLPVPVIGVVEPGARAAASITRNKQIAVLGTETTISSGSYVKAIKAIDESISVRAIACPLFVPLIEEGWIDGEIINLTVEKYLSTVAYDGVDTIVLGCTHYPIIKHVISNYVKIPLIDSAIETAREVSRILELKRLLRKGEGNSGKEFYVTDSPEKFAKTGQRFLGHELEDIKKIDLYD